jgi:DNA-binding CsgD family transcriptional regulator
LAELTSHPIITSLDYCHHALLQADLSLLEGDTAKAVVLAETAVKRAADGGNLVMKALSLCVYTMALYEDGQCQRAAEVVEEGLELTRKMRFFRSSLLLTAAFFALENGEQERGRSLLREGFGLAARQGYLNFLPWRDGVMIPLCREALAAEIEVNYVTRLAECHGLSKARLSPQILTPKEMETLRWVQEGKTTWEIAKILGVSEATVKFHVGNVLRKLGANSRTQAVAIALKTGLLNA